MNKGINATSRLLKILFYSFLLPLFLIFLMASMPLIVGNSDGQVRFRLLYLLLTRDYIKGLFDGTSLIFNVGQFQWHAFKELPPYFLVTLFYAGISSFIGVVVGFPMGILRYKKLNSPSQSLLTFIGSIPDFFIILLLQLTAIYFMKFTGMRLAKIAMTNELPLLLPLIAMSLYPIVYVTKQVSRAAYETSSSDYIQFARAKGITRKKTFILHLVPALLPGLAADSTKVAMLVLANVFIAENLFFIKGITHVMIHFSFQSGGGYQFDFVVTCLLYIFMIYQIINLLLRLFIRSAASARRLL
ncbi:MAG: ABC transporter permease subunit [Spirochaetales bacterium]|nr:ABC transporter permease subunit [Spirochaetales bacterium]